MKSLFKPVQPRLRGELIGLHLLAAGASRFNPACAGNSKMRQRYAKMTTRFNPACAGNSQLQLFSSGGVPVQPRLRGELHFSSMSSSMRVGSTPLARGTPRMNNRIDRLRRFNPACAGNSVINAVNFDVKFGSTPLARGTRISDSHSRISKRFNPACAGNSLKYGIRF